MEYQIGIFQSKIYNGDCENKAIREGRTRVLTFDNKDAAIMEYNGQIKKAESVLEYALRHSAVSSIYFNVRLMEDGKVDQDYNWTSSYNMEE